MNTADFGNAVQVLYLKIPLATRQQHTIGYDFSLWFWKTQKENPSLLFNNHPSPDEWQVAKCACIPHIGPKATC